MNERIKKLAEQAGFETDRGPLIGPGPYIKVGGLCVGVPLEKFAELIVVECSDLFEIEWGEEKLIGNDVGYVLKKHFGVEE
jgi:hypothetical protein